MAALPAAADVVVIGSGHNALVAATFLARAGLSVVVVEGAPVIGGATRTERPFPKVPDLQQSTGSYLLGLMPPELPAKLGVRMPTIRRDPHYFLPTTGERYLLFGSDREATRRQYVEFFSAADWAADEAMQAEIAMLREDLAETWLTEPLSLEGTADRFVRPSLQSAFVDLCRGSVGEYLDRFGFSSDLVTAMYAVTDGLSGLDGTIDSPGSGHNFLVHNMCRLPGSGGTWMVVRGGMGTVSRLIADEAIKAGAVIATDARVARVTTTGGITDGVALEDGRTVRARVVVAGCDPFTLRTLADLPAPLLERIDGWTHRGTTMKVNLALRDLPVFRCLPQDRGQHQATIHLLPQGGDVLEQVRLAYDDAKAGRLAEFPTIEWYIHTTIDPSLRDAAGHHSSALFVQWAPWDIAGSSWDAERDGYVEHL
ncbi:MAG: hypothetical protein QOH99_1038, partial [Frankiaceae bacterium]|nr:hypothetical protein [Frankiaceae bacterium]